MSTNARTWFYNDPEANAYSITERLNGTCWQARMGQIIFHACTQATAPYKCTGYWREIPIEVEWQPRQWFAVRGAGDLSLLMPQFSRVLGLKPTFRCKDETERDVYEWHFDRELGNQRWQAIQGLPTYKTPQRLNA